MNIKDLECFNQDLLAKQAWKLVHFEDCLMTRVLKGKYFGGGGGGGGGFGKSSTGIITLLHLEEYFAWMGASHSRFKTFSWEWDEFKHLDR